MAKSKLILAPLALLAIGCASIPEGNEADVPLRAETLATSPVRTVDYEAPATQTLVQPEAVAKPEITQELSSIAGLSLQVVEELALANHPTVAQSQAQLRALHGKWLQVGLAPNPTIGYMASEIGSEGSAGQQGGFVGQEFVRGDKLERNRAIVCAEIEAAEQALAIVIRRVQTDVRLRYYNTLLAQRRVQLAENLVHFADEAVATSKRLIEAQEIPLSGLLQTEVQLQNAQLMLRTSNNSLDQAWRQLQTLLGEQWLERQTLEGDVSKLPASMNFENQLAQLQLASPEVAAAMAEVVRSRRALNRACVEAVPNIDTQLSVQYDDAANETLAGVQIGFPLPVWNRNQGGIRQAQAEVTQAQRNVDRVERNLQQRLVDAFREYADARVTAETYASEILTRAEQTLDLVQQGYAQQEVGYLELLTAQRTYSQTNLAYLDALENLWQSHLRIEGLLLEDSLAAGI